MTNTTDTRRGFIATDKSEFSNENLLRLKKAQEEIFWLINRSYSIEKAVTFVGNHYMLSNRQRLALMRATATTADIVSRKKKEVCLCDNQIVYIDGLNLIITLEVALSMSVIIKCMDGTIRDLAGLRGTYRLIDKTDMAIKLIGRKLKDMNIAGAIFYIDAPVSNTGRLKARIFELLGSYDYDLSVELINNVDTQLKNKSHVVTSDAIILNDCVSWVNLANTIISENISDAWCVRLDFTEA